MEIDDALDTLHGTSQATLYEEPRASVIVMGSLCKSVERVAGMSAGESIAAVFGGTMTLVKGTSSGKARCHETRRRKHKPPRARPAHCRERKGFLRASRPITRQTCHAHSSAKIIGRVMQ